MSNGSVMLAVFFGLVLSNFTFAAFSGSDWHGAFERSFFQGFAIFAVWFTLWMKP